MKIHVSGEIFFQDRYALIRIQPGQSDQLPGKGTAENKKGVVAKPFPEIGKPFRFHNESQRKQQNANLVKRMMATVGIEDDEIHQVEKKEYSREQPSRWKKYR